MTTLTVCIQGIGLLGPGLASWASARDVLRGVQAHTSAPTVLPPPARLPPAERRRAGAAVKLALAIADEAVSQAQLDPATLATPAPMVSPTRFTNSVHNAPAGCWHIAVASRASSTSLCAFDGSFSAGLIEAATSVQLTGLPVLLVASDSPYPAPLHALRPLPDHFGAALVLAPEPNAVTIAELTITFESSAADRNRCDDPTLDALRRTIPAACVLPLLAALARPRAMQRIVLDYLPHLALRIELA